MISITHRNGTRKRMAPCDRRPPKDDFPEVLGLGRHPICRGESDIGRFAIETEASNLDAVVYHAGRTSITSDRPVITPGTGIFPMPRRPTIKLGVAFIAFERILACTDNFSLKSSQHAIFVELGTMKTQIRLFNVPTM